MLKKEELDEDMDISEVSDEIIEEIYERLNIIRRGLEDDKSPLWRIQGNTENTSE